MVKHLSFREQRVRAGSNLGGHCPLRYPFTKEGGKERTIKVPKAKARYITIGLPETVREPLHLAKVKVYGLEK